MMALSRSALVSEFAVGVTVRSLYRYERDYITLEDNTHSRRGVPHPGAWSLCQPRGYFALAEANLTGGG